MPLKIDYCGSVPTIDMRTMERAGWWYGWHFVSGEGEPMPCPNCGKVVGMIPDEARIAEGGVK